MARAEARDVVGAVRAYLRSVVRPARRFNDGVNVLLDVVGLSTIAGLLRLWYHHHPLRTSIGLAVLLMGFLAYVGIRGEYDSIMRTKVHLTFMPIISRVNQTFWVALRVTNLGPGGVFTAKLKRAFGECQPTMPPEYGAFALPWSQTAGEARQLPGRGGAHDLFVATWRDVTPRRIAFLRPSLNGTEYPEHQLFVTTHVLCEVEVTDTDGDVAYSECFELEFGEAEPTITRVDCASLS